MELEKLPFKIGMHYENWELDLEVVEDIDKLERYKYLGKDITKLFGQDISGIYLYFSWDILHKIELFFSFSYPMQGYNELTKELKNNKEVIQIYKKVNLNVFKITFKSKTDNLQYKLQLQKSEVLLSISCFKLENISKEAHF